MEKKFRIAIVEDCTILREGLRSLLGMSLDFEIVGEAEDGLAAITCAESCQPDLVLLDLSMPKMTGLSAIKDIKRVSPKTKILTLTVYEQEEYILEAFRSGADGYCLKDTKHDDLISAIKTVLSGKPYFSPGVSEKVLEGYLEGKKTLKSKSSWETITSREREILKLIGEGYKNKKIAELLCLSEKTVEKHRANIMEKLNLHNTAALTALAIEKGLVVKEKLKQ
ncbi:MAG TPA: response regulator transcription factor [Thermodesulfobacteriota bacterium]|nr:response regulator transcription factor [Thermodesulfobacteriota bacterium]